MDLHFENHYYGHWVDLFMSSKLTLPALCVLTILANLNQMKMADCIWSSRLQKPIDEHVSGRYAV